MSSHLITLQDYKVSILTPDELLASSPGFAHVANKVPVFGEEARVQARLHPRESFNQFWSQLSLDPLPIKNKHFRHAADIAHGHLLSLTQDLKLDNNAVIAVPSHYNRNQLAVLLGIIKTCQLPVNGLVDISLLQALASDSSAESCIVIDLQLHQAVLSSFSRHKGLMQRDRVVQVPASGILALQDAWTNMIADEFIKQSRFDPMHNAEIEQYLYNQLDQWITDSELNNELKLEISHQGAVHQAMINYGDFALRSKPIYERINKALTELSLAESSVHIIRSHLGLPGLTAGLPGIVGVDDSLLMDECQKHLEHIQKDPEQLHFITRLPLGKGDIGVNAKAPTRLPSHLLFNNKAIALPLGRLLLGQAPKDFASSDLSRTIPLKELGDNAALVFNKRRDQLILELINIESVQLNGESISSGAQLALGDTLQIDGSVLQLIQVE